MPSDAADTLPSLDLQAGSLVNQYYIKEEQGSCPFSCEEGGRQVSYHRNIDTKRPDVPFLTQLWSERFKRENVLNEQ